MDEALFLWPVGIGGMGCRCAAHLCLGSRRKAEGMQSCLGVLALLWASMEWSYWLFAKSSRILSVLGLQSSRGSGNTLSD